MNCTFCDQPTRICCCDLPINMELTGLGFLTNCSFDTTARKGMPESLALAVKAERVAQGFCPDCGDDRNDPDPFNECVSCDVFFQEQNRAARVEELRKAHESGFRPLWDDDKISLKFGGMKSE